MPLTAWLSVQTLDRDHHVWHCLGTGHLRRHLKNALQPTKAMEWQVQGHDGLCTTTAVCRIVLQAALFEAYMSLSQYHHHRDLQTPLPARLSLIHGPLPRPCAPDSMDTGRASVQLRDSNHTISHALLDEIEHRPWSALTRGLCQGDDEAGVERELCAAVVEAVAVAKSQHGKCTADMRHLNHVS
jgi:hypothetical protein